MLKVGITGGIGSGKTTVCKIFEVLGIPVFYADAEAKRIMNTDDLLMSSIRQQFGDNAYSETGQLNRSYLAGVVFNDEIELEKLNKLVHPAVFRAFNEWVQAQKGVPYVVKETALLFESEAYKLCNYTILVSSTAELKIRRVIQRDNISKNEVELRMKKQFTDVKTAKLADFIVTNDEKELLLPQVIGLHEKFLEMALKND